MKTLWKNILVRGLPALLILGAAGCGAGNSVSEIADGSNEPEPAAVTDSDAGKYTALGIRMDEYVVKTDSLEGNYLDLAEDGKGYLFFGDDNQGDISSWEADGGSFSMKAGVSEFTGTMKNGLLDLELGDNMTIVFAKEGADTSSVQVLTPDEYKEAITKGDSSETETDLSVPGRYEVYAAESQGICIYIPEEDKDALIFELNEDGTGMVYSEGEGEKLLWKLNGDKLEFFEADGTDIDLGYGITLKDGIITFEVPDDDGEIIYEYLVKEGADTSEIDAKAIDPSGLN